MQPTSDEQQVRVELAQVTLPGILGVPPSARAMVIFAHGSGSSRLSPRNNYVARVLRQSNIATFLFDLLTEEEDLDYERRFDIRLLTQRLLDATHWLTAQPQLAAWSIGYFGASTGSAAALYAAAAESSIRAVVSRGGRPDLAMDALPKVQAPTLLIVGGNDIEVIKLNREAYDRLLVPKELAIIPGATHLFEEPGALDEVARLATEWFQRYLKNE